MSRRIGIDVGGTKCLGVVIDDVLHIEAEIHVSTPSPDLLVSVLAELIDKLGPADHVGVGLPGLVTRDGVVRSSPNLPGARDLSVAQPLAHLIGKVVHVQNDANCAARAEWRCGVAVGLESFVMVTLGTGIGGGIIVNGSPMLGAQGFAGEIGHMIVAPQGRSCGCGMNGCWERYASGSALAQAAGESRGEEVFARARRGDVDAREALEDWARWVGIGLANLTNMFDPEAFVIGGGVVDNAHDFVSRVEEHLACATYAPDVRRLPRVLVAQLGPRAGAIGAALLTRD